MAKTPLFFYTVYLLLSLYVAFATTRANSAPPGRPTKAQIEASSFVKTSCSSTTYPKTCVESLAVFSPKIHRDHGQLALTSLLVGLSRARSAHRFVSRFHRFRTLTRRERVAVEDCAEEMDEAADQLDKAVRELKGIKGKDNSDGDFLWHMSNLQTWVSAALTDENTCVDGFAGKAMDGRVKASIAARSKNLIEVTSNALALCNLYAQKKRQ